MSTETPDFEYVPLASLQFDTENPRFPTSLDASNLNAILTFMLQDAGLLDLMRSIAKQGFFPGEPILVSPALKTKSNAYSPDSEEKQDSFIVVEGNRRLAACTLLANPELAPINHTAVKEVAANTENGAITSLPCLKFSSREMILDHLGYRHVTGIKEWDPLAKARFLDQQFKKESGTPEERLRNTARTIGSRSDYVGRLLTAFKLYQVLEENKYFQIAGLTESSINFSLIPSVLAYADIAKYLGLDGSQDLDMDRLNHANWKFVASLIFESDETGKTRLGESRNIRALSEVLTNSRALEALKHPTTTLSQARQLLGGSENAFRSLISQAEQDLRLASNETDGPRFTSTDVETLERIRQSALELRRTVQNRIDEEN